VRGAAAGGLGPKGTAAKGEAGSTALAEPGGERIVLLAPGTLHSGGPPVRNQGRLTFPGRSVASLGGDPLMVKALV